MKGIASPLIPPCIHPCHKWPGILRGFHKRLKYQLTGNRIRENLVKSIDQTCKKASILKRAHRFFRAETGSSPFGQVKHAINFYYLKLAENAFLYRRPVQCLLR